MLAPKRPKSALRGNQSTGKSIEMRQRTQSTMLLEPATGFSTLLATIHVGKRLVRVSVEPSRRALSRVKLYYDGAVKYVREVSGSSAMPGKCEDLRTVFW